MSLFKEVADMENLCLPSPEDEFDATVFQKPQTTLNAGGSNGGVYSELVRIFTLW